MANNMAKLSATSNDKKRSMKNIPNPFKPSMKIIIIDERTEIKATPNHAVTN